MTGKRQKVEGIRRRQGYGATRKASAVAKAMADKGGFTLIELLTVITIIGILAALIVGASKYALQKSRRSSIVARIATLEAKLEDYKADNGIYPKQLVAGPGSTTVLYNALAGVGGGKKYFTAFTPYEISKSEVIDPFGNEYQFQSPGIHNLAMYDLWSSGPDGKSTTTADQADDITNWQSN